MTWRSLEYKLFVWKINELTGRKCLLPLLSKRKMAELRRHQTKRQQNIFFSLYFEWRKYGFWWLFICDIKNIKYLKKTWSKSLGGNSSGGWFSAAPTCAFMLPFILTRKKILFFIIFYQKHQTEIIIGLPPDYSTGLFYVRF